jgi:hypothetical protein
MLRKPKHSKIEVVVPKEEEEEEAQGQLYPCIQVNMVLM